MVGLNCRQMLRRSSLRSRVPIVLGFTLSFFALVLPFYNVETVFGSEPYGFSAFYWSFKASGRSYPFPEELFHRMAIDVPIYVLWIRDIVDPLSYPSVYFFAYWLNTASNTGLFSQLVMTLFAVQLTTLATALSSLFIRGRSVRLATVLSGVAVVGLMLYVGMSDLVEWRARVLMPRIGLGFWLAVLAEIVFAICLGLEPEKKVSARGSPS